MVPLNWYRPGTRRIHAPICTTLRSRRWAAVSRIGWTDGSIGGSRG
jgi:hypothetical protein